MILFVDSGEQLLQAVVDVRNRLKRRTIGDIENLCVSVHLHGDVLFETGDGKRITYAQGNKPVLHRQIDPAGVDEEVFGRIRVASRK